MNKLLVIGCGSIGRRHIGNFRAAGIKYVIGADPNPARLDEAKAKVGLEAGYRDFREALAKEKPDAVVIATPPSLHLEQANAVVEAGAHIFLEKPAANTATGLADIDRAARQKNLKIFVAYCHRFIPSVAKLKELLEQGRIGKPYAFSMHWGSYLPSWHPWEDYRAFYMARKAQGGGALLDESHGLDLLRFLFGEVASVSADIGTISHLEIDSDDWAAMTLRFKNGIRGLAEFDLMRHNPQVRVEVIGQKGSILWDRINHRIEVYSDETKSFEIIPYTLADVLSMYNREVAHFIECVRNGASPRPDLADGIETMRVLDAAFVSAERKAAVEI